MAGFDPFGALASLAGGVAGFYFGGPMGAAAGSGLGTALYTGDLGKGVQSGLLSYGLGSALGGLSDAGTAAATAGSEGTAASLGADMVDSANAGLAPGATLTGAAQSAVPDTMKLAVPSATVTPSTGAGAWDALTKPSTDFMSKVSNASNALSGPGAADALKDTFITHAGSTTVPIGLGLYSMMQGDPNQNGSGYVPPKQGYQWPKADLTKGTGRTYTPQTPNRQGYEQSYFTSPQYQYASGGWISGAIKHPGALHRELGIPEGQKIPSSTLASAANSSNPLLAKRAHLAQTMRGFDGGGPVSGPGDGLNDAIPAIINGRQPASLSDGEYVVPAHAVSALGNGSTQAGVKQLDGMVDRTMQHKFGSPHRKPHPLNARRMMPV